MEDQTKVTIKNVTAGFFLGAMIGLVIALPDPTSFQTIWAVFWGVATLIAFIVL